MITKKFGTRQKVLVAFLVALTMLLGYKLSFTEINGSKNGESPRINDLVNHDNEHTEINVGPKKIKFDVEVVSTDTSRQKGLSGRTVLKQNHGMLFVFDKPDNVCFWMKDMMFNIDILWFDENTNMIYFKKNAKPANFPESYCPNLKAKYVLEINSGLIQQNDFKLGDKFNQQEYGIKL